MSSKIGILSDIHGNYNALKAVINKARKNKITSFIFCGDLIGYYYVPFTYDICKININI